MDTFRDFASSKAVQPRLNHSDIMIAKHAISAAALQFWSSDLLRVRSSRGPE